MLGDVASSVVDTLDRIVQVRVTEHVLMRRASA